MSEPFIAEIVTAYGSPGLVELQLAATRRFAPPGRVASVVVDDCSPQRRDVAAVCERYGAAFLTTPREIGHYPGAIHCAGLGMAWAAEHGFAYAFHRIRRFVPLFDWTSDLLAAAAPSTRPTFGSAVPPALPLRFDAFAARVTPWAESGAIAWMAQVGLRGHCNMHAAGYWAARIAAGRPFRDRRFDWTDPPFHPWPAVVPPFRTIRPADPARPQLWRGFAGPADYAAAARSLGLIEGASYCPIHPTQPR